MLSLGDSVLQKLLEPPLGGGLGHPVGGQRSCGLVVAAQLPAEPRAWRLRQGTVVVSHRASSSLAAMMPRARRRRQRAGAWRRPAGTAFGIVAGKARRARPAEGDGRWMKNLDRPDARHPGAGLPLTFVRSKLAIEKLALGEVLEIVVDHQPAAVNVPRSMEDGGAEGAHASSRRARREWRICVRKERRSGNSGPDVQAGGRGPVDARPRPLRGVGGARCRATPPLCRFPHDAGSDRALG